MITHMGSAAFLRQFGVGMIGAAVFSTIMSSACRSASKPISLGSRRGEWEKAQVEYEKFQHMNPMTRGYFPAYATFSEE